MTAPIDLIDRAMTKNLLHSNFNQDIAFGNAGHKLDEHFAKKHQSVEHSAKEFVDGIALTIGIESGWAVAKRGNLDTNHDQSIERRSAFVKHLTLYPNREDVQRDRLEHLFGSKEDATIAFGQITVPGEAL